MSRKKKYKVIKGTGEAEGYTFNVQSWPALADVPEIALVHKRCINCICKNKDNPTDEIEACSLYGFTNKNHDVT